MPVRPRRASTSSAPGSAGPSRTSSTYYEQVARLFLQAENAAYAASFFGKAREAERVHGLVVDEDRQRAVFLKSPSPAR
ncbi:hypothetical protein SBADM41S_06901 [Streptomyces badius]